MNFNGLHLLAVIATLICVYVFAHYVEWRAADRDRRMQRLVHRNLMLQTGRRA